MRRLISSQVYKSTYSPKGGPLQGRVVYKWQELGSGDNILTEELAERGPFSDCRDIHLRAVQRIFYTEAAEHVFSAWDGRTATHYATASEIEPYKRYYVAYNTLLAYDNPAHVPVNGVQLNVNISPAVKVCYLLWICIPEAYRGKGFGGHLYTLAIEFAREVGCDIVVQTASGKTFHGETREEYLKRRGWSMEAGEAFIELIPGSAQTHYDQLRGKHV